MTRKQINRVYGAAAFVVFVLFLLVGTQVPVSAQFTAQIQRALQQLGIWPYDGSYANGDFPVWNSTSGKFLASTGGGGSGTVIFTLTSNAVGIGTATPNVGGFGATNTVLTIAGPTLGGSGVIELLGNRNAAQQSVGSLNYLNQSANSADKYVSRIIGLVGLSGDVDSGALSFTTYNDSGVSATRMLIDENGNTNLVGTLGWGATLSAPDAVLSRGAANRLDLASGDSFNIVSGQLLSAGARVNYNLSVYGAGTAYAFTNTAAAIDLGTTDPVLVLDQAGTYLIFGQVHMAYAGATVVAETATIKVRRTNNTATDLSALVVIDLPVATTLTNSYGLEQIPPFIYTTAATNDSITLFANVSATLGAGTINATAIGTSLVAIRLY